jgi:DNA-directed RNA polymerase subunit RPC12/RpoP
MSKDRAREKSDKALCSRCSTVAVAKIGGDFFCAECLTLVQDNNNSHESESDEFICPYCGTCGTNGINCGNG